MSTQFWNIRLMRAPYHHGDLRGSFLEAALTSLDQHGELPSWRALARACAVSQTAPYRHFENLEALQIAVATECFARLTLAIRAATEKSRDPFERLARGLHAYVAFGRAHPSWYELMFGRTLVKASDEALKAAGTTAYGTLVEAIAACEVVTPAEVAFTLWCAVHGITDLAASSLQAPLPSRAKHNPTDSVVTMCVNQVREVLRTQRVSSVRD